MDYVLKTRLDRWGLPLQETGKILKDATSLIDSQPDMALTKCRKALELLITRLFAAKIGEPSRKVNLDAMLDQLERKGHMPRKIVSLSHTVRILGNTGAHPILDDEDVTHREAQLTASATSLIVEWYQRSETE
jgi:hypothetical protein